MSTTGNPISTTDREAFYDLARIVISSLGHANIRVVMDGDAVIYQTTRDPEGVARMHRAIASVPGLANAIDEVTRETFAILRGGQCPSCQAG